MKVLTLQLYNLGKTYAKLRIFLRLITETVDDTADDTQHMSISKQLCKSTKRR